MPHGPINIKFKEKAIIRGTDFWKWSRGRGKYFLSTGCGYQTALCYGFKGKSVCGLLKSHKLRTATGSSQYCHS